MHSVSLFPLSHPRRTCPEITVDIGGYCKDTRKERSQGTSPQQSTLRASRCFFGGCSGDSLRREPIFMCVHLECVVLTKEDMIGSALHHAKWNASPGQFHAPSSFPGWSCSCSDSFDTISDPTGYGPRCELIFFPVTQTTLRKSPSWERKTKETLEDSWRPVDFSPD